VRVVCSKCGMPAGDFMYHNLMPDDRPLAFSAAFMSARVEYMLGGRSIRRHVQIDEHTGLCRYADLSAGCHYQFLEWIVGGSKGGVLDVAKDRWEECRGKQTATNT
jgi:hypothetical protein